MEKECNMYNTFLYRMLYKCHQYKIVDCGSLMLINVFLALLVTFGAVICGASVGASKPVVVQYIIKAITGTAALELFLYIVFVRFITGGKQCKKEMIKSEKKNFGAVKTPPFIQYVMFDFLCVDVFKNALVAITVKMGYVILSGYGLWQLVQINTSSLYALLFLLVASIVLSIEINE